MIITALVKIANECEIIESFIRYNFNVVDRMVFVSTCCVDNTSVIIRKLIKEGYNIELIEEPDIAFEERKIDNKYIQKIADDGLTDLIIPHDADEFIGACGNPRKIIENLSLDRVYTVKWKNYALCEDDDPNEAFIPKRIKHAKKNYKGNNINKVIVPAKLVKQNDLIMTAGRHSIIGKNIVQEAISSVWISHFPVTSLEQYKLMIYEERIKVIIRSSLGNGEGSHKFRQLELFEKGEDFYAVANDYGFGIDENARLEIEYDPLDISFCSSESTVMKYVDLSRVDSFKGIFKTGQLMAIKSYNMEKDKEFDPDKKTVLIFGTGEGEKKLLNGCPDNVVNIRAYIDNDPTKQLRIYNKRIVIPPEYIRFFKYDKIIISSDRYFDEIYEELLDLGVNEEKIGTVKYIFDMLD